MNLLLILRTHKYGRQNQHIFLKSGSNKMNILITSYEFKPNTKEKEVCNHTAVWISCICKKENAIMQLYSPCISHVSMDVSIYIRMQVFT